MDVAGPSRAHNITEFKFQFPKWEKKRPLPVWNHYVLASESPVSSSDEGCETTYSIQGKETDLARDTSDLDSDDSTGFIEYDVPSDDDDDKQEVLQFLDSNQSSSDEEVIKTTVISAIIPEGDIVFADSEASLTTYSYDSELGPCDYWKCIQCLNPNNNPKFRYCEKCYKLRKDFFPPPPKRRRRKNRNRPKKQKKAKDNQNTATASTSECLKGRGLHIPSNTLTDNSSNKDNEATPPEADCHASSNSKTASARGVKRKYCNDSSDNENANKKTMPKIFPSDFLGGSLDLSTKEDLADMFDCKSVESFSQPMFESVALAEKSFSEPIVSLSKDDLDIRDDKLHISDDSDFPVGIVDPLNTKVDKSVGSDSKERSDACIVCLAEPKSGVFVHGRIAHICCCYKCSVKIWIKTKRCPICKCKVSNVLRAFMS